MAETEEQIYTDKKLDTLVYKCPNCGGEAVFDPNEQKMKCLYCESTFEIDSSRKVYEQDLQNLLHNAVVWNEADVYQCKSCGAKEIVSKQEMAHQCPFCGTNNIIKTEELPGIQPHGVVPFKLDKEKAENIAKAWAKKKLYAPRKFKKSARSENLYGVYNPVFTFDSETKTDYNGRLGKNHYYTTYRNGKPVTETRVEYFHIKGNHVATFDDIIVQASSSIPAKNLNEIAPFPTNNAPLYKSEFLHGYSASTYNKDGKACWHDGQNIMKNKIEAQILSKYTYDVKDYVNMNIAFLKNQYKYVLVPVYVGHYKYKNKLFNFYINGDTGKISGKTPVSGWKVFFTVLLTLLVIGGISILYFLFAD
ncbi:MAG: hypothetical protein IJZ26_03555 [Clostridia bacterium]|nr:hypothetical protein [Clostridia bacterium]